jgi:16S rRNA (adenine(1408)-N(1))-methyltransferase
MRVVEGRHVRERDGAEIAAWAADYDQTILDLGTGDGRFVNHLARRRPRTAVVGVDLVAANLRRASRAAPDNALFVVADALDLPIELSGLANRIAVNFPWGSLLRGLLEGDSGLLAGLVATADRPAALDVRLNADALAEAGWETESGAARAAAVLRGAGFAVGTRQALGSADLRTWPTTWAKRLAFGRDPRAVAIEATIPGSIAALAAGRSPAVAA